MKPPANQSLWREQIEDEPCQVIAPAERKHGQPIRRIEAANIDLLQFMECFVELVLGQSCFPAGFSVQDQGVPIRTATLGIIQSPHLQPRPCHVQPVVAERSDNRTDVWKGFHSLRVCPRANGDG
jgi:hypothetical protein